MFEAGDTQRKTISAPGNETLPLSGLCRFTVPNGLLNGVRPRIPLGPEIRNAIRVCVDCANPLSP